VAKNLDKAAPLRERLFLASRTRRASVDPEAGPNEHAADFRNVDVLDRTREDVVTEIGGIRSSSPLIVLDSRNGRKASASKAFGQAARAREEVSNIQRLRHAETLS